MEKSVRIIIAGGRDFNDYPLLEKEALSFISGLGDKSDIEIVSGGAKGVDALGERFAKENGLSLAVFPADWKKYGRTAGPQRNKQMADYATHLLSFWNGESRGTKSMITLAKKKSLNVKVVAIESSPIL
jgi:predicted Rossmann fold nucleotide-binding protein DprA/Smf involved in DNA uptake